MYAVLSGMLGDDKIKVSFRLSDKPEIQKGEIAFLELHEVSTPNA